MIEIINCDKIEKFLNRFPEVTWDRFACSGDQCSFYGWIPRHDGKFDFLLLEFDEGKLYNWMTSSKRFSLKFYARIHRRRTGHNPCQRVEHWFPKVKCIKLKKDEKLTNENTRSH